MKIKFNSWKFLLIFGIFMMFTPLVLGFILNYILSQYPWIVKNYSSIFNSVMYFTAILTQMFPLAGIIFIVVGIINFIKSLKEGTRVPDSITEISENTSVVSADKTIEKSKEFLYFKSSSFYGIFILFLIINFFVLFFTTGIWIGLAAFIFFPPIFLVLIYMCIKNLAVNLIRHNKMIISDRKKLINLFTAILILLTFIVILNLIIYYLIGINNNDDNVFLATAGFVTFMISTILFIVYFTILFIFLSFIRKNTQKSH